jgi:hypothetical protein
MKSENLDLKRQVEVLSGRVDDLTKRLVSAGISPPPVSEGVGFNANDMLKSNPINEPNGANSELGGTPGENVSEAAKEPAMAASSAS